MRGGGAVEEGLRGRGRGRRGESGSRDSQAAAAIYSFLSVSEHGAAVGPLIINQPTLGFGMAFTTQTSQCSTYINTKYAKYINL